MTLDNDPKDEEGQGGQICVILHLHFKKTIVILVDTYWARNRPQALCSDFPCTVIVTLVKSGVGLTKGKNFSCRKNIGDTLVSMSLKISMLTS